MVTESCAFGRIGNKPIIFINKIFLNHAMKQTIFYIGLIVLCLASCNNSQPEQNKKETMANSIHFESGHSDVNGIKMYYEIHGQGQPLVLIHGGGSTITTSFGKILPMLAEDYKVIAVELQAHGHTSDRNSPESFEQDADDVVTLLKNLKIEKASFFGFSNGGNTAMQIANRHPEIVQKLILASTFYKREGFPPGFFEGI